MSDRSLTPELLLGAYATGVFPMSEARDDPDVFWVDPRHRGILPIGGFKMSRSLAKRMRRGDVTATLDRDFRAVIDHCADRPETWINTTIRDLMLALARMGYAHSFEVWRGSDMIGGLYGVALGSAFFGESMFSRASDGSKMALAFALDHLRRTGFTLFDTQFLTPHLASLGAIEISRDTYRKALATALETQANIYAEPFGGDAQAVVQRMTQTS